MPANKLLVVLGLSCLAASAHAQSPCCSRDVTARGLAIADQYRVEAIAERRFTHAQLWAAMAPSLKSPDLKTREIGQSNQGRAIRAVTFGHGKTTVLLWSQMHGDESTATMALADIFRFLAEASGDPLRARLDSLLTITFVPMLNPDGAEIFQRHNAQGIDVNRDARRLSSPEARALKSLRDELKPMFGFNLHDQGARTRVGSGGEQAAIALLAPATDADRGYNDVRSRARLVASVISQVLAREIPGRVSKYDDTFNPRAFGDLIQHWGTSTVLIESGALPGDPQKQRLRKLNVAAILAALDAIGTGSYARAGADAYEKLPFNASSSNDILVLGGMVVVPGRAPYRADVAIAYDDAVALIGGKVREIGDLDGAIALDTLDATGLYLHPRAESLTIKDGRSWWRIGSAAHLDIRSGAEASSALVRQLAD
jgi:hypothetical protein